jgi:hypothetical protein
MEDKVKAIAWLINHALSLGEWDFCQTPGNAFGVLLTLVIMNHRTPHALTGQ